MTLLTLIFKIKTLVIDLILILNYLFFSYLFFNYLFFNYLFFSHRLEFQFSSLIQIIVIEGSDSF